MTNKALSEITDDSEWDDYSSLLLAESNFSLEFINRFSLYWIESGHRIREQINDDSKLVQLLRHLLPAYQGASIRLYRGENIDRWNAQKIGLAWTPKIEIAEMFAKGLNSIYCGGVLLESTFDSTNIICGPNSHSIYLGEHQYTIDPYILNNIVVLKNYTVSY